MPPAERKDNAQPTTPTALSAAPTQPPSPPPPVINSALETVIIFDWDDTLLASSFLSGKGYRLDNNLERPPELEAQLKELEQSVINVLTLAMNFGPVHIVTNAETGWVQMSAQKFIPGVVPVLSKVKVVSARSTYEAMFPDAPLKWKFYAFQEKLASSFTELKTEKNVISFGDSYVEREAVRAVTKGLPNTRTKSVKFAERPSMEQLRRQIELVGNCFQYIYNHDGDLDLQLTVTVNPNPTSPPSPTATSTLTNTSAPGSTTPPPSSLSLMTPAVQPPPLTVEPGPVPVSVPTPLAARAPVAMPMPIFARAASASVLASAAG